ncbi:small GTP-binding protein domain [Edhazardia aedis USNM 41457]|uniref:Small GTP-binding protein domain n=1 Tax=Edhazardia aedis (strain USNM 41457) TaxID=1003232 RepID=J9D5Z5_EDHAE|nr:small GTP-binding protein domain [Edhazardia aedis USNM 41457]|eukprot:EJW02964.1 small GTP-binding protein domain [Edhazardia aedis USNM 41457]
MGIIQLTLERLFPSSQEQEIAIVGLDNAGKTTILYRMKDNQSVTTIPTIGFNVEKFKVGKISFNSWDIGGQDEIRALWASYIQLATGIVFVVDKQDKTRWPDAALEIHSIYSQPENKSKPLLILANKTDDPAEPGLHQTLLDLESALNLAELKICYKIAHCAALETRLSPDPLDRLLPAFKWLGDALLAPKSAHKMGG